MELLEAIDRQPEHSSVVYEDGSVMLQRTVLVDEHSLSEAFDSVPWQRLVFLRCDRQKGGRRILLYRWRPETEGWERAT